MFSTKQPILSENLNQFLIAFVADRVMTKKTLVFLDIRNYHIP